MISYPEKPSLDDYEGYIALRNCVTVNEVEELLSRYNWGDSMRGQIHFADANRDALVIGPRIDGNLAFTRKKVGDGYLISTNFNIAAYNEEERVGHCWRYNTAHEILRRNDTLSLEQMRDLLTPFTLRVLI